jgi:uncharacterized protein YyaL (SSP411 family)
LINETSRRICCSTLTIRSNGSRGATKRLKKRESRRQADSLSIGYSACHWCHVMEHESFEDEETARMMNENFVNIKVDLEERPDVDQIYMNFVQMTSGHGGYPLNVFLTPDKLPFFGGTYFPPVNRYNMPSFQRFCERRRSVSNQRDEFCIRRSEIFGEMQACRFDRNEAKNLSLRASR